nr:deoxyguanosine kinase (EC 2.7.1.113) - bovine (fragments) [Bos taurus]
STFVKTYPEWHNLLDMMVQLEPFPEKLEQLHGQHVNTFVK